MDILTGETKILRTDIVYDCGQSMNPAVDMGQVHASKPHYFVPDIVVSEINISLF